VLCLGMVTPWIFREAVRAGRLRGKRFPWRKYAIYRRDAVMRAFRLRPCDADGNPADAESCGWVFGVKSRKKPKARKSV
jgi:hypothetical protein